MHKLVRQLWPKGPYIALALTFLFFVSSPNAYSDNKTRMMTIKLWKRLTRSLPDIESPYFITAEQALEKQDRLAAGLAITKADPFIDNLIAAHFGAQFTNLSFSHRYERGRFVNDFSLNLAGGIRDDIDYRVIWGGDQTPGGFMYRATKKAVDLFGIPATDEDIIRRDHYDKIKDLVQKGQMSLNDPTMISRVDENNQPYPQLIIRQFISSGLDIIPHPDAAGLLTAHEFLYVLNLDGTLRRAWQNLRWLLHGFKLTERRASSDRVGDHWIRRDVSRAPGGVYQDYQKDCRTCHAVMDAIIGCNAKYDSIPLSGGRAQRYYDGTGGSGSNGNATVNTRTNRNPVFPNKRVVDDSFEIMADRVDPNNPSKSVGWYGGQTKGNGWRQFGPQVTRTSYFETTAIKMAFEAVCQLDRSYLPQDLFDAALKDFKENGYNYRRTFAFLASSKACLGAF